MVNIVMMPIRQSDLNPISPSLVLSDSMILVGVVPSGFSPTGRVGAFPVSRAYRPLRADDWTRKLILLSEPLSCQRRTELNPDCTVALLRKACNRLGFRVRNVQERQQLGNLKHLLEFAVQMAEPQ